jgi:hypothetical protein
MEPLDLRLAPPREPRAELAGIIFLPRSIDKVRATLPGGHLGDYRIVGFTQTMLERFGISLEDFTAAVRRAQSDDDVAAFVVPRVSPAEIAAWNAMLLARPPGGGVRARALELYPFLAERPDLVIALDVLQEDDRRSFSA